MCVHKHAHMHTVDTHKHANTSYTRSTVLLKLFNHSRARKSVPL